jgi:hypothetical protein
MSFPLISCRELVEQLQHAKKKKHTTSGIEMRCVYDVARKQTGGDADDRLSRAFAICRASLQKSGRMKKDTADLTKLGKKRSAAKSRRKDHEKKVGGFERLVVAARKARDSK